MWNEMTLINKIAIVIIVIVWFCCMASIGYVSGHFIAKYW
jgi:hypothetical protein